MRTSRSSDGSVAASLSLAFSFGPKSDGGWRVSSEKLASRGQVIADVWMDENGDGVRQPGEAALPGVPLTAGRAHADAATDAAGAQQAMARATGNYKRGNERR